MNLIDRINSINKIHFDTLENGKAHTVSELWDNLLIKHLPKPEVLLQWVEMLEKYVERPDAVFVVRAGNVRKNGDEYNLRRGFYTKIKNKNISFVYTDNDFSIYVYVLACSGYCPSVEEFSEVMSKRLFPVHFNKSCKAERQRNAFPISGKTPNIGKNGFKLSHIIDTGMNYFIDGNSINQTAMIDKSLGLGNYSDWTLCKDGYYVREIETIRDNALDFLKAHFLRFACPFNYILTPKAGKKRCHTLGVSIPLNDIGESKDLQEYAIQYYLNNPITSAAYQSYLKLLLLPDISFINKTSGNTIIDIEYGINCNHKGLKTPKYNESSPKSKVLITTIPNDINEFKTNLITIKKAFITWQYNDGRIENTVWNACKFNSSSNLIANVCSSQKWRKEKNNLISVTLTAKK